MARPTAGPGRSTSRPLARVRAGPGGAPLRAEGWSSCSGFFLPNLPYLVWQRVAGTLGRTASRAFLLGRGRFVCPLRPLFHTHVFVFPAPVFLPSRPASLWIARHYVRKIGMTNSEHVPRAAPRIPRTTPRLLNPASCLVFYMDKRCPFLVTFPTCIYIYICFFFCAVFQSSICLRFFLGGFFALSFGLGVRVFGEDFWALKCSKTAERKALPVLALFSEFYFCYGAPSGGFWDASSVSYDGVVFAWFWACVFVWIYVLDPRSSFFGIFGLLRFFALSLPPSPSPPPFLLVAGPGSSSFSSVSWPVGHRTSGTCAGRSSAYMMSFLSVSSFCPGRSPSPSLLPPSVFSLSLSLFFLSLA